MAATPSRAGEEPPPPPPAVARSPEDAALVQSCLAGVPGAWDAFVARFAGLFRYVVDRTCDQRKLALSAADRDDVIAEILVEVLKADAAVLRGFAGRSSLATYLAVVARRAAVRMMEQSPSPARATAYPGQVDAAVDPAQAEQHRVDRDEVESLLTRLDPEEAKLVRLHHLEARSYGEISRMMGMPLGSIGPALSRARQKMRDAKAVAAATPAADLRPQAGL
ncbi:MAG: sigma-70 family RNA polymerase sigma factor [Planctomycetota bacterium]|nr:MAG: sigma-70 family RNA polymerase sigma factor [Planctomycetota bacterium]